MSLQSLACSEGGRFILLQTANEAHPKYGRGWAHQLSTAYAKQQSRKLSSHSLTESAVDSTTARIEKIGTTMDDFKTCKHEDLSDLLSSRGRTQTSLLGHGCYTPQAHDIRLKASVFGKSKGNPRILRPRHQHLPQQAVDSLVEAFVARLQRSIEAEKTHSQMNSYRDWISHLLG
ncbi:hypothetical protein FOXG_15143 [Fusarium oxysporum f. sp. lycopersici 4287]|uniref:Uncharacterized protein n=2 Tax=Fusarium oxysporum TaxID=5507 RepID=A0A0J9W0E7_FUSO4|nr:hypothetical protein FOXG_14337 [Fusarium oxysporum f. sp. lycopersici 4287]XP_018255714.1 hypothetical protein FOXG_15143 [Fusarium oxysporum f. sp. lycopersici 4287]KNB16486.1 hypothetical protein FOXG_14337 [Fusarium oxysporum f. sp. lycopersici 4287]KNB17669.1 hypothetical protein FOXG_15143 [Fusarium oxysporum f. sp. lycopersici 4287]